MAKTVVSDVIVPELFAPYVIERSTKLTEFGDSDIVERGAEFNSLVNKGAKTVQLPYWKGSTVSSAARQIISASSALSVNKIDSAKDVARISNDANAWSVTSLAKWLSGDDPMMAIGEVVSQYWAEIDQGIILNSVKGLIGAASFAVNLLAIHNEDAAAVNATNKLTGTTFIDALQKLGDHANSLTAIAVHSATRSALEKLDLIDFIPDSEGRQITTFRGRRVIVTDEMTNRAGTTSGTVYTSILFGPGAIAFGDENLSGESLDGGFGTEAVEFARVALNHDALLINRRRWLKHPRGMAWQDVTIAEDGGPDDTELAEQQQWVRVWNQKNIRMVVITHNN